MCSLSLNCSRGYYFISLRSRNVACDMSQGNILKRYFDVLKRNMWLKGNVQRKIRWVEIGINRQLLF
jgi:hypothetical protein